MTFRGKALALIASIWCTLVPATANALQFAEYASFDNWRIYKAEGNQAFGCSLVTYAQEDDVYLTITISLNSGTLGMVLGSPSWDWVVPKQKYAVNNEFDSNGIWEHTMVGAAPSMLLVQAYPSDRLATWMSEFVSGNKLVFAYTTEILATIELAGSRKAVKVWTDCVRTEADQMPKRSGNTINVKEGRNEQM